FQPLSPEGKEILQSLVDNVHSQFVSAVAKGRGMSEAQVRKLADGRVYSGAQAKELGLVDQFGTLDDAIEFAAYRKGCSCLAEGLAPLRMVALSAPIARRESPDIDSDSLLCREGDVMTKRDLIDEVNKRFPHLSRRDSEVIINAIFDSMVDALAQGDRIEIRGFGS